MNDSKAGQPPETPERDEHKDESFEEVVEVRFLRSDLTSEIVSATMWSWDCAGSILEDEGVDTVVTAWFPPETIREAAADLGAIEGVAATISGRRRIDWLQSYEQSLEPLAIGTRFVVTPREELAADADRIRLIVPQEQAFGTGSHESTSMCIELLETLDLTGARCLDVGTGSGILAIAMVKLGAERVFAFDNDLSTWGVIEKNLRRNRIPSDKVQLFYASADALLRGAFGIVAMNILPHVIIELVPHIVPVMEEGGDLIVSGVPLSQRDELMRSIIPSGLTLIRETKKGEWWAGMFRRS